MKKTFMNKMNDEYIVNKISNVERSLFLLDICEKLIIVMLIGCIAVILK